MADNDSYKRDMGNYVTESVSIRSANILKKFGIVHYGDLVRFYRENGIAGAEAILIACPSCGRKSVNEITNAYRAIEGAAQTAGVFPQDADFIAWCLSNREIIEPLRKLSAR